MASNPRRRGCLNCPGANESHHERLWQQVLLGLQTRINLIESYVATNLPGVPLDALQTQADRLNACIARK